MSKLPIDRFPDQVGENFPFSIWPLEQPPAGAVTRVPQRHSFYVAIWVTAGEGQHVIDFDGCEIKANALHFVRPGQLQYWAIARPLKGYILCFDEQIYHYYGLERFFNQLSFLKPFSPPAIFQFSSDEATTIQHMVEELVIEAGSPRRGQEVAILSWLNLLLLTGQRRSANLAGAGSGEQLTNQFVCLVDEQVISEHSLTAYATQLGVTVGHLTETVNAVQGQPAGAILRQRLALEAKRLLAHTDKSAAQIAESLNFRDPSYFGRFFKRETSQTPRTFRAEFRRKLAAES